MFCDHQDFDTQDNLIVLDMVDFDAIVGMDLLFPIVQSLIFSQDHYLSHIGIL